MKHFTEKACYPFTYGDKNVEKVMLSDYIVKLMKTKRFKSHTTAIFFALLTLGSYAQSSSAIPAEYGDAANEMLNQAAQNGAAGGAPVAPPIGPIQGQVPPIDQGNPQFLLPRMPIEQQYLIAAQQAGKAPMGPLPKTPTEPPSFYIPNKPRAVGSRAANTVARRTGKARYTARTISGGQGRRYANPRLVNSGSPVTIAGLI